MKQYVAIAWSAALLAGCTTMDKGAESMMQAGDEARAHNGGLHHAQATSRVPHGESRFRLCRFQEMDVRRHDSHRLLALDLNVEAQGRTTR